MSDDNALEVLLQLMRDERFSLSEDMVRECFAIQKKYQHDRDREVPLNQIRRLIETEAARQLGVEAQEENSR